MSYLYLHYFIQRQIFFKKGRFHGKVFKYLELAN